MPKSETLSIVGYSAVSYGQEPKPVVKVNGELRELEVIVDPQTGEKKTEIGKKVSQCWIPKEDGGVYCH